MKKEEDLDMAGLLPYDMMLDIFARLPVKTLSKFRCVSKSWCNLISDPCFLKLHHDRSKQNLLLLSMTSRCHNKGNGDDNHWTCNFNSMDIQGNVLNAFTLKFSGWAIWVLPTSCDLVCLSTFCDIYLCNPSTQQLLALPKLVSPTRVHAYGFAYLPSTKEYKVVRLYTSESPLILLIGFSTIFCEVFTLSDGGSGNGGSGHSFRQSSWRMVQERCPYFVERSSSASVNETIYWKIEHNTNTAREKEFIVSFNTESEKFKTISYPAECSKINKFSIFIMELGGMLCMVDTKSTYTNSTMVIWTLKDYDNCIWVKGYSIDMATIDRNSWGDLFPRIMSNGEIIMSSTLDIKYFYNIENKSFRRAELKNLTSSHIYWEGFFSLGSK